MSVKRPVYPQLPTFHLRCLLITRLLPDVSRTVPVAAGVVGNLRIGTLLTARDVPAERRRAAGLDRRHHFELAETQMAGLGMTPAGAVGAEDIRDLQSWSRHGHRTLRRRLNVIEPESQQATA